MTVDELKRELESCEGHWPVVIPDDDKYLVPVVDVRRTPLLCSEVRLDAYLAYPDGDQEECGVILE